MPVMRICNPFTYSCTRRLYLIEFNGDEVMRGATHISGDKSAPVRNSTGPRGTWLASGYTGDTVVPTHYRLALK